MKILLAEDNDVTRKVLEAHLAKWGYEVIAVADGSRAWDCLQQHDAPHLLILDWMMPGMSGIDICRQVRQSQSGHLKHIILLTARGEKQDLMEGFEAGANDYMTKNFDPDELKARVGVGARVVELQQALANRVRELEQAMSHIKTLQGILPICMHCHKIRDDREVWLKLEEYIADHTDVMLSHSLCPECMEKYYSDFFKKTKQQGPGPGSGG
jgi:DNA-binding response OmpR family regulator